MSPDPSLDTQNPSTPTGQRRKGLATRQRILDVSIEFFIAKHFDDVSVLEIAKRADVVHGLIFHHFGNKANLHSEVVEEISRRLFNLPLPDPSLPPYFQIRKLIDHHFSLMEKNENLLISYMRNSNGLSTDAESGAVFEGHRAGINRWALELLGYDPQSEALRTMLRGAASALFHLSVSWLEGGCRWQIKDQLIEATIQIMIGSFRGAQKLDPTLQVEAGINLLMTKPECSPES